MITLDQYLMGRHLQYPTEYNSALEANAIDLVNKVNLLLAEIGEADRAYVSSGFRPKQINQAVKGAARGSKHITCQAVDIRDVDGTIGRKITREILKRHQLWMEHPGYTKTWVHLQSVPPSSGSLVFIPF